jgi:hypothetical protein
MTTSIVSKAGGTQGSLQINGVDSIVFDSTGVISGVNKSAVTQMPTLGTSVATTSGTAIDFTGIPSWVKRITLMFNDISLNGTDVYLIQLGSGSPQTTGYLAQSTRAATTLTMQTFTTGFGINGPISAAESLVGAATFTLMGANTWICIGNSTNSGGSFQGLFSGRVVLGGVLDRVRITTLGGANTFDAGSINILYE